MAWCRQATSHCLSQCWPRSLLPHGVTRPQWVNSLAPEICEYNFACVSFLYSSYKLISLEHCLKLVSGDCHRTPLMTSQYESRQVVFLIYFIFNHYRCAGWNKTWPLVQVTAWCHQAPSHYLSQCRPRSMTEYGVTRQQWVEYEYIP